MGDRHGWERSLIGVGDWLLVGGSGNGIGSGVVEQRVLPVVGVMHELEPAYLRWLLGTFYWLKRSSAGCRSVW
jgi:hypothetical protein